MRALVLAFVVTAAAVAAPAADWPQFRGPNRDGTSPEKGLLRAWPADGPKVLWTVPVGKGYGGAAVRDGEVYLLDRTRRGDALRCLDFETGKEKWSFAYSAPGRISHDGSRATPTVGEKYVFIVGVMGQVHCVDRTTHKALWNKHLLADFGGRRPTWAVSQSPILYKDWVIVAPQTRSVGVVALEKATGKEVWRSGYVGRMQYASPVITTLGGVEQVVMAAKDSIAGVNLTDGKLLWRYTGYPCRIPVPDALPVGDDRLFITGGYEAGSVAIRVRKTAEGFKVTELGREEEVGSHVHTPLLHEGYLYALCNTNSRANGLVCFDLTGKIKWKTGRDPYLCKGGMVLTGDGLIYSIDGRSGDLRIIQPDPDGYKELAKAPMLSGREIWGPLALSNGRLIVRDHDKMKCVRVKPD
jgi:outer membrane protein assembly factor BamB